MCARPGKKPSAWRACKDKIKQKILDLAPSATFKDSEKKLEKMDKIDSWMSRPDVNRAIMGATAIILQPTIDACNRRVDDETRKVSIYRTLAKIIAGTTVGIAVRGLSYMAVQKMTDMKSNGKHSKALIPDKYLKVFAKNEKFLKNHKSTLSTGIAILAMCITNFVIDAPLTVYLTNKFISKSENQKELTKGENVCDDLKPEKQEAIYG